MSESFLNGRVVMHGGDSREVLKTLADHSIDSIVCDPPYALVQVSRGGSAQPGDMETPYGRSGPSKQRGGFMGKQWDTGETAFAVEFWQECLRVLKPGGHVVAFSGTRTYHRMACAIEDAGFEIRDQLQWVYGSGFPKSHDVSKGIDRAAGAEREKVKDYNPRNPKATGGGRDGMEGATRPWIETALALGYHEKAGDIPVTEDAIQWQGWGTALKPACEPICFARKPLGEKTVAANVLAHGTGAINIDGCRVGEREARELNRMASIGFGGSEAQGVVIDGGKGRWPANILHDGSDEVIAAFPDSKSCSSPSLAKPEGSILGGARSQGAIYPGEDGSAARFFYTAKADAQIFEEVTITWISESEPCQATLLVDMGQSPGRATVASVSGDANGWSTFLSGSALMDLFQRASMCTTRTKTSSITESRTWSYLTNFLTKEFTGDLTFETGNGGSRAENAGSEVGCLIFTLAKTAYLPGANLAASGTQLKISVSAKHLANQSEAKRFWYTSKAGADDRLGSSHPTVKPVDLMQWLCRLVTPKGGTILDPFAGTGTTGEAAFREGFNAVLIEREAEYQTDIRRRMALCMAGPDERKRESIKAKVGDLPFEPGSLFA